MSSAAYERTDVRFPSGDADCGAFLYRPKAPAEKRAVVVCGHGLGAVKEMGLEPYAAGFASAGYVVLVFDYRHFGASGGEPRQLLDIDRQLEDWRSAVAYARTLPGVDPERVAIFGSSFGGGHVIVTAADDPRIAAAIAQCPFTSGSASAPTVGFGPMMRITGLALRDAIGSIFGAEPVRVPLAGPPGSTALMNAPDAEPGYLALLPAGLAFEHTVAARVGLHILAHHPGRRAADVRCPILFSVCENDSVAPAGPTLAYAAKAPKGEVARYPIGHFDIYRGEAFERAFADQLAFLKTHVPTPPA